MTPRPGRPRAAAVGGQCRAAGHDVFLTAVRLPNGWTETFDGQRVSAAELRAAIRGEHPAGVDEVRLCAGTFFVLGCCRAPDAVAA